QILGVPDGPPTPLLGGSRCGRESHFRRGFESSRRLQVHALARRERYRCRWSGVAILSEPPAIARMDQRDENAVGLVGALAASAWTSATPGRGRGFTGHKTR